MQIGPYTLPSPYLLAPMAGVSDMPFRVLVRELGCGGAPTELVSAKGLVFQSQRTRLYLRHHASERPFWVQLFGAEPESMARGAELAVELGAEIVDVNMGCPVKKVVRDGAGAALHRDVPRAAQIVAAIVARVRVPVTAKIRIGWDDTCQNYLELAKAITDAGCATIAIHARTRAQGYSGRADWRHIRTLVEHAKVPVIGNGDATTPELAQRMMRETGCAAVMIGRGALGNPWLFRRLTDASYRGPTPSERWELVRRHLLSHLDFVGDAHAGLRSFRPHLLWYSHGLSGAADFRRRAVRLDDLESVLQEGAAFFCAARTHSRGENEAQPASESAAESAAEGLETAAIVSHDRS